MKPAVGLYVSQATIGIAPGTVSQVANRNTIAPFVPRFNTTIDQVGVSISTGVAGTLAKVVIYGSDADGRPGNLIAESSDLDCGTSGTTPTIALNVTFEAGKLYWVGVRCSGTQTMRSIPSAGLSAVTYTAASSPTVVTALTKIETYGNAAGPWGYSATHHANTTVPLVLMRIAS